jgi:DNA primase
MDVIALHRAGFGSAVATLGTAVTPDHARLIARYVKRAALAYDSDAAGERATERAAKELTAVGVDVTVLRMEGAKDPDDFIAKFGRERFGELVSGSKGFAEDKVNMIVRRYDLNNPDEKIKAADEACGFIASLDSRIKQEVYGARLAQICGISEDSVTARVTYYAKRRRTERRTAEHKESEALAGRYADSVNTEAASQVRVVSAEEELLGALLNHPEEHTRIAERAPPALFATSFNRGIYERFAEALSDARASGEVFDISAVLNGLSADEASRVIRMYMKPVRSVRETIESNIAKMTAEAQREKIFDSTVSNEEWAQNLRRLAKK